MAKKRPFTSPASSVRTFRLPEDRGGVGDVPPSEAEHSRVVAARPRRDDAEKRALLRGDPHQAADDLVHRSVAADGHDERGAVPGALLGEGDAMVRSFRLDPDTRDTGALHVGANAPLLPPFPPFSGLGVGDEDDLLFRQRVTF